MNSPVQILIVDDERPARDKLRRLLSEHLPAAQLREARDGAEALKILGEQQCDAVFLDIHMPSGNGFTLLRKFDKIDFEKKNPPKITIALTHKRKSRWC